MNAYAAWLGVELTAAELARLCHLVENAVVGAPCGAMDQFASACGRDGALMALNCAPPLTLLNSPPSLPAGLRAVGLDSGVRHAVGGSDYGSVRVGAFMGRAMAAALLGAAALGSEDLGGPNGPVDCLAGVQVWRWERDVESLLPETIGGAEFLQRFRSHGDEAVTRVDPARVYAVRSPASHPVRESQRVQLFAQLLRQPAAGAGTEAAAAQAQLLGKLMLESHCSYGRCGLGCRETDLLVDLAVAEGPAAGVYGAKISGGGSGGTVVVLLANSPAGDAAIERMRTRFASHTGRRPFLFAGSSPGAAQFGVLRIPLAPRAGGLKF